MIYKMELSDSVDTMVFDLLEVPIVDKDITGIAENTTIDGNVFNDYLWLKKQYVQKWSIMCQDEYDRLRGFWTRQFGDAEVPFYRLFYGENVYEDKNFLTSDGFTQIMNPTERTAPLSLTHLYGNAEQKTISGKNLADLVPITLDKIEYYNDATVEMVNDSSEGSVLHIVATGAYPTARYTLPQRLESGGYYSMTVKYRSSYTGTGSIYQRSMWFAPNWSGNGWDTLGSYANSKDETGAVNSKMPQSTTWKTATWRFYVEPTQYSSQSSSYAKFLFSLGNGLVTATQAKEVWVASVMLCKITQAQYDATTYADSDFQEYCGGIPSPNPDYPQNVKTVSGAQTVKITGKNLCTNAVVDDGNHVSFYCDIGTIKNNTLTLTAILDKATTSNSVYAFVDGINIGVRIGGFTGTAGGTGQATLDLSGISSYLENGQILRVQIYKSSAGFTSVSDAMIVNGSTPEPFEPYQAQSQEINLGKNLFDISKVLNNGNNTLINNGDGTLTVKGLAVQGGSPNTLADYCPTLKEGDVATFNATSTSTVGYIYLYGANTAWNYGTSKTITSAMLESHVAWYGTSGGEDTISNIQLELGTQPTPYSAYKTPIELAKIGNYQDYIWNDGGTWKIHKEVGKVMFDGSESGWGKSGMATSNHFYYNPATALNVVEPANTAKGFTFSDNFCSVSLNDVFNSKTIYGVCLYNQSPQIRVAVPESVASTANAFTTWLASHPTTVYYAQATPTDTEITDSELIEQLNHIYSLYQGQNNLWLIPNAGAQGEIDGTYRLIYDEETDIIPKTPVVLTLTDGGVINPCGCRQNIQLIMRETEGE